METFKVNISREDYGYIIIRADSAEKAEEMVESGDWTDDMYIQKNGGVTVDSVIQLRL